MARLVLSAAALLLLGGCDAPGSGRGPTSPWVPDPGLTSDSHETLADATSVDARSDSGPLPDMPEVSNPDTSTTPRDVAPSRQPLAGFCILDKDCIDGFCNSAYAGGYCTTLCGSNADCPDDGLCYDDPQGAGKMCWKPCDDASQCRLDQFCPGGAFICTPKCQPDRCSNPSYVCDEASGECKPPAQVVCEPANEVCDGQDNDCDRIVDEGCGPGPAGAGENLLVDDLGLVEVGGGGLSKLLSFDLSSAAGSFTIVAISADATEAYMGIYRLESPSGEVLVVGTEPWDSPIRALPEIGWVAAQVPNTPLVALETGTYSFQLWQDGAEIGGAWVYVIQNIRPQYEASQLDLNLWFVGLPNLTATSARTSTKFQLLLSVFTDVLDAHGVRVGEVAYHDIKGTDGVKYTIVDTSDDYEIDEHDELLALSRTLPQDNTGVNFFFVTAFNGWGLLGRAGGIPGPALFHGTWGSGVVVSMTDYFWGNDFEEDIALTAEAMAHELGHQLGLYHTTERTGDAHDPIPDTPECTDDQNKDGIVDASECKGKGAENLMFWQANLTAGLTGGQKFVIHRNPNLYETP